MSIVGLEGLIEIMRNSEYEGADSFILVCVDGS